MSQSNHRRDNLANLISDMESDVRDLVHWATVVYDLGSSDNCEREGVHIVGHHMGLVAKRVEDSWQAAFNLSRGLKEGAR